MKPDLQGEYKFQGESRDNRFENPYYFNRSIDLNCDLGQKWGPYSHTKEENLLPFVSSVNIACGAHAGDSSIISDSLRLAKNYNLNVGAHIGYPDLQNFGRKEIRLDNDELTACVINQLGSLAAVARMYGITISHFRPHGAMYYKCCVDNVFAEILAKIASSFSSWINFVCPSIPSLSNISDAAGIKTIGEVHLDRPYRRDGSFYKFASSKNVSYEFALAQARSLIFQNKLIVEGGRRIKTPFRTIHLNMDRSYSASLAEEVFKMLNSAPTYFDGTSKIENLQSKDLQSEYSICSLYE